MSLFVFSTRDSRVNWPLAASLIANTLLWLLVLLAAFQA